MAIISVNKLFVLLVQGACMTLVLLIVFKHKTYDAFVMHENLVLEFSHSFAHPTSFLDFQHLEIVCVTCMFN